MTSARLLLPAMLLLTAGCAGGSDTQESAAREVSVRATDELRFEPAQIATARERVTFVVSNVGTIDHEFVIGSPTYLSEHAEKAAEAGSGEAHADHGEDADGAAVAVPAGKTVRLTFELPEQPPSFACYVDRHDQAGMTGTVVYY